MVSIGFLGFWNAQTCKVSRKWDLGLQVPRFSGFYRFFSVFWVQKLVKTKMQDYWCMVISTFILWPFLHQKESYDNQKNFTYHFMSFKVSVAIYCLKGYDRIQFCSKLYNYLLSQKLPNVVNFFDRIQQKIKNWLFQCHLWDNLELFLHFVLCWQYSVN